MVIHRLKRIRSISGAWWFLRWVVGVTRLALARKPTAREGVRPASPKVTIIMATNRPSFVPWAVDNVRRQSQPHLEFVLSLHGEGFDEEAVRTELARLDIPSKTVHVAGSSSFGDALNAAAREATGEVLTKMDDDDLYGGDHVRELVQAWRETGARLVGKAAEWTYLCERNVMVNRYGETNGRYRYRIAGNTLTISRTDFDRIGGWRPVPRGADTWLIDDVIASGGMVYRAPGRGHVVIRHGEGHTNDRDDDHYVQIAEAVTSGWRPSLAGIHDIPDAPSFPGPRWPR